MFCFQADLYLRSQSSRREQSTSRFFIYILHPGLFIETIQLFYLLLHFLVWFYQYLKQNFADWFHPTNEPLIRKFYQ